MLCKKCNTENLLKADYCQSCGNMFTQEEKDAAYEKTIFGKFEKAEKYISYLKPVEIIKGNKLFRIGVLVGIIVYSILISNLGGNHIRVEESAEYELIYNKTQQAYYIISDNHTVDAKLHIPSKTEYLEVCNVDENGVLIYSQVYDIDQGISLTVSEDYHYVIQGYKGNDVQAVEVYVVIA